MGSRPKASSLRLVRVVLYTRELRLSGFIRSPYPRLSDTLNRYVRHVVELHDVTTQPLRTDRTTQGRLETAAVAVDEVVLAMPRYTVGIERSRSSRPSFVNWRGWRRGPFSCGVSSTSTPGPVWNSTSGKTTGSSCR